MVEYYTAAYNCAARGSDGSPDFTSLLPDDGSPPLCHYNIGAQMADIEYDQAGATGGGGVQRITLSDFPRQV
ncbi:hypothetical protein LTR09_002894 [Extremus antarcticus]|uniref:Uncharacterized protein n=1 Tax=Extremus antarcticus TaxID=702011 RepID=A0AAJ0GF82_9PEZI|nr:hypothetical protein LTR09_002894 [Extremus antarcticus]